MQTPHYVHRIFSALIILGLLLTNVASAATSLKTILVTVSTVPGQPRTFTVEVADNDKTRTLGLSGRTELAADHGMLFAFAQPAKLVFWMPDMHFPIDIIWLDADQHVLGFVHDAEPCIGKQPCNSNTAPSDPNTCQPGMAQLQCPLLPSPDNTKFVLELPAGSAQALNLQVGTPMAFDLK